MKQPQIVSLWLNVLSAFQWKKSEISQPYRSKTKKLRANPYYEFWPKYNTFVLNPFMNLDKITIVYILVIYRWGISLFFKA